MEIKKIRLGGILLPSNVLMAPLAGCLEVYRGQGFFQLPQPAGNLSKTG